MWMLHIRRTAFPLRSLINHHPPFNFSSICLCFFFLLIPPWSIHSLCPPTPVSILHLSSLTISVVCPDLSSRDISTTLSSHHYDRWMEIVWLRDPTSIPALHTKPAHFRRLMDSLFGTVFNLLLGVGSFGCSIFIPLRLLLPFSMIL